MNNGNKLLVPSRAFLPFSKSNTMNKEQKTAITNVRVFNGSDLSQPTTVVIEGDRIGSNASNANIMDGQNGVLLPGFIDAHVHCTKTEELHKMARAGITTALDMGCWPPEVAQSLRHQRGVTDYRSAGPPLTAPGSSHSRLPSFPEEALVVGKTQAIEFVKRRITEGSEHIKLVVDIPGPDQETIDAAAEEARDEPVVRLGLHTRAGDAPGADAAPGAAASPHHRQLRGRLLPRRCCKPAAERDGGSPLV